MNHPTTLRLRELIRAKPFRSFTFKLVDGTAYVVPDADTLAVTKSGNVIFDDGERIKTINATLVAKIEENPLPPANH